MAKNQLIASEEARRLLAEELLQKALHGDVNAFGELFQREFAIVAQAEAQKSLTNEEDVNEMVQDVCLRLLENSNYQNVREKTLHGFKNYIRPMTHNMCANRIRKACQRQFSLTDDAMTHLRYEQVPEAILAKLASLQGEPPAGSKKFERLVTACLAELLTPALFERILYHSRSYFSHEMPGKERGEEAKDGRVAPLANARAYQRELLFQELIAEIQQNLSAEEWDILRMKAQEGRTFEDIAHALKKPRATVHHYYQKILAKVRTNARLLAYWREYHEE